MKRLLLLLALCPLGAVGQSNLIPAVDVSTLPASQGTPEVVCREEGYFWAGLGFGFCFGGMAWAFKMVRQAGKAGGYEF